MTSLDISCFNPFNLKNNIMKIEHKKIFRGLSIYAYNISRPLQKPSAPPSSYIINVRSLMFLRKFKKPISWIQIKVLLLCSLFFIRTFGYYQNTKWQRRTHINKAPNIDKIINHNYEIMAKIKISLLNFPKSYLISIYVGVILSSCNTKDNSCFT